MYILLCYIIIINKKLCHIRCLWNIGYVDSQNLPVHCKLATRQKKTFMFGFSEACGTSYFGKKSYYMQMWSECRGKSFQRVKYFHETSDLVKITAITRKSMLLLSFDTDAEQTQTPLPRRCPNHLFMIIQL